MGGRRAPCVTHTFVTGREHDVVEALRAGDERAFAAVVDELSPGMLRMARHYVRTDAAAEEVVQEAWLVVVNGLDDFEGRSTLRTWVFGIVINIARGQGVRDARTVPFAALVDEGAEPAIGPERFLPADHDRWPGHWAIAPGPWPDHALETAEALAVLREAVAALPEAQRAVITLRDVVGCSAEETCNALGLSATNQRVLLHRARTRVRVALETYFEATVRLT
jgi:RNA polymerase sigma-70 factor (ECF subfamily)